MVTPTNERLHRLFWTSELNESVLGDGLCSTVYPENQGTLMTTAFNTNFFQGGFVQSVLLFLPCTSAG